MTRSHKPIMPSEVLGAWFTERDGKYIDGTFGRGGHSSLLLEKLSAEGCLLAIDRDPEAIAVAKKLQEVHQNLMCEQAPFAEIAQIVERLQWQGKVSGIFLDLGVSSPQLDDAARGFSFMRDGPLDMRMDPDHGESAAQWLARAEAKEIARVLLRFGEEPHARRIARNIVEQREVKPLKTTSDLVRVIEEAIPARDRKKHKATRAFQAIRIFINGELEQLEILLQSCLECLAPGGRLVVISFHSLEDRMVKRFMRNKALGEKIPSYVPIRDADIHRDMRSVIKSCRATEAEIAENPRARSAVLRAAEKMA